MLLLQTLFNERISCSWKILSDSFVLAHEKNFARLVLLLALSKHIKQWKGLFQSSICIFLVYIADLSTGLLKHWKKVRVELSGEGAGYDVTRGYNQVKVKTSRIRNQLPSSGHCPLSLSEHVVSWRARSTRVLVSGETLERAAACSTAWHNHNRLQSLLHEIAGDLLTLLLESWCGSQRGFQHSFQHRGSGLDPSI